jgi:membrane protease YdiL (CAAX protease family)
MKIKTLINWKLFGLLLGGGVFGFLALLPYILTVQADVLAELPIPLPLALLMSLFQTTILMGVAIFVGLFLGRKVGLGAPLLSDWLAGNPVQERIKPLVFLSVTLGTLAGVLIIGFDYVFSQFMEPISTVDVPLWQGLLASFYGGIVEEILLRLLLVTLLVWLMWKFSKIIEAKPSVTSIWVAIISAAVIFGLGHLPATAVLTTITPIVIIRAVLLNGIGGIIFGWLYWRKGLEPAMIAHFTTDVVLLVLLPVVLMSS